MLGRPIPVITDAYVSLEFGTGALKITPAHDFNDFEVARRHDLPAVKVIDEAGLMTAAAGKYQGMDRFACRAQILKDLKADGLLVKVEPYTVPVGHCYRCKTVVEPLISQQWFVAVKTLAAAAVAAVEDGRTRLIPPNWDKSYYDWMTNIRDWCISRQIWWGHRIPAWTCAACGRAIVSREDPAACPACGGSDLVQETDVLDTWFSSALWPFSTLGWPDATPELKLFYPTSVLVTAFDILFFWVARMMMMGLHFMGEVPFREVYIHALVRDPEGQKMSKSKGNVIDPLELMDKYGTDAFRFSLAAFAAMGRDVRLSEERIEGYRNFANKIWNASRFILMNLEGLVRQLPARGRSRLRKTPVEAWILSRLQQVIRETRKSLDSYAFDQAANTLYQFIWHEFCDWYLELIKPQLYDKEGAAARSHCQGVLLRVLSAVLRLLHPFMPFITEEIWQETSRRPGEHHGGAVPPSGPQIRPPRGRSRDEPGDGHPHRHPQYPGRNERAPGHPGGGLPLASPDAGAIETLNRHQQAIKILGRILELHCNSAGGPPAAAAKAVVDQVDIFMPLAGIIDFAEEAKRLDRELEKLGKEVNQAQRKMSNEDFLAKAPAKWSPKNRPNSRPRPINSKNSKPTGERIRELMGWGGGEVPPPPTPLPWGELERRLPNCRDFFFFLQAVSLLCLF